MKGLNPLQVAHPRAHGLFLGALLALAVLTWIPAVAAPPENANPLPPNPADLVRETINNELASQNKDKQEFFTWKERSQKPSRTVTKQMVESSDGVIGRVFAINDQPPSAEDRKHDDERINRLLDPKQMADKRKEQKQDEDRTLKMVRSLPDAFHYEYAGTETAPNGHLVAKLKFTPNPNFNPPTRETLVFEGMQGTMTIDATLKRLLVIDGRLFKDVTIGWGIIGRLNQGGHFYVEQAEVYKGHWDQVKMDLDFTGKALIFKTIRINQKDTQFDFQPVQSMNVAQALDFLRKQEANGGTINAAQSNSTSVGHNFR